MIAELLSRRQQIKDFNPNKIPEKEVAENIIRTAFNITASKQNLYPYKVHVLGPNNKQEKLDFYDIVCRHPGGETNRNIKSAPYCLIFTIRLVTHTDSIIEMRKADGHTYPATDPKKYKQHISNVSVEIGMFAKTITALALEQGLDVAYTGCLPNPLFWEKNKELFKKLYFVDDVVIMAMQFGYKLDEYSFKKIKEKKPDIAEVINWLNF